MACSQVILSELAEARPLHWVSDESPYRVLRDLAVLLATSLQDTQSVAREVAAAFDLATAGGAQLDVIGRLIGLPREGWDDIRYRELLYIQRELSFAAARADAEWTGTGESILRIARLFIGATGGAITLTNFPPYSYVLSIPSLAIADAPFLARFLRAANFAGVLGQLTYSLASDSLWASGSGAVTGKGIWCSDSVAVAGCASWGTAIIT